MVIFHSFVTKEEFRLFHGLKSVPPCQKRSARLLRVFVVLATIAAMGAAPAQASENRHSQPDTVKQLRQIYDEISRKTGLPWQAIAAIDQYERTLTKARPKSRPVSSDSPVGVYIPEIRWAGELNPDPQDTSPVSIQFFGGIGRDGDGDGQADRSSGIDLLYTVASHVREAGTGTDRFRIGLWNYYQNDRAVHRIMQFETIIRAFGRFDLNTHAFPLPLTADYSYKSTWGASRGWGGYRIHEGTDIFARYGVPVRSTSYGIVELMGWNRYGGWRVGIRDLDNMYHYYAHLQGFDKKLKPGDVVRPGQIIGWVGSSGYGKPGTQGKFPPHLHYGVYRDRGMVEWAFDPYPLLRKWEREERRNTMRVAR
jgi:murein DD-endopeptidase MepM/ murein hydrolase activator NlpD